MVSFGHLSPRIFQNWEHLGLDRQCSPGKFLLTVPHSSNSYSLHFLVCLLLPSPHLSILRSLPNRIIRRTLPRTKIFSWVTIFSGIFLGSDCLHNRTQIKMMSRRNREKARVGCNQLALSDQVSVIHKRPLNCKVYCDLKGLCKVTSEIRKFYRLKNSRWHKVIADWKLLRLLRAGSMPMPLTSLWGVRWEAVGMGRRGEGRSGEGLCDVLQDSLPIFSHRKFFPGVLFQHIHPAPVWVRCLSSEFPENTFLFWGATALHSSL